MSIATLPKDASYLQRLSAYQIAQSTARRAQRRLDQLLRQRGASPQDVMRMSAAVEVLWARVDRAGSAFAREKDAAARKAGLS